MSKIARLATDQEELAINMISEGAKVIEVAKALGFKDTNGFLRYRRAYPDFEEEFQIALQANSENLEDKLLNIDEWFPHDAKMADVVSKNTMRVLGYRSPKRYGDKIDLNVTQTIDIAGSLERAERRVIEAATTNVLPMVVGKITGKKDD